MNRRSFAWRLPMLVSAGLLPFSACQKFNNQPDSPGTSARAVIRTVGTDAQFNRPMSVAADALGDLFVADMANNVIRKIAPDGTVSTFAGTGTRGDQNGPAEQATFNQPISVAVDASRNVFVVDAGNNRIRKITAAGIVSNYAGNGLYGHVDGQDTLAQFATPVSISTDGSGNLYVVDKDNQCIRRVTRTGVVTTLTGAGTAGFADGPGKTAQFNYPSGVVSDPSGNLYVADNNNFRIRKVSPSGYTTTIAGNGTSAVWNGDIASAEFVSPHGISRDAAGNLYVTDGSFLRKITATGTVSTITGSSSEGFSDGVLHNGKIGTAISLTLDPFGNIYIADYFSQRIRKITGNLIGTVAGNGTAGYVDGPGSPVKHFWSPDGVTVDNYGNVYVADEQNNRVVAISAMGTKSTLVLAGGVSGYVKAIGTDARMSQPKGVAINSLGELYISEFGGCKIRYCNYYDQYVGLLAGANFPGFQNGLIDQAQFNNPAGIGFDVDGNVIVADYSNSAIRKVTLGGITTTIAGTGSAGYVDGPAKNVAFNHPADVKVDASGNIYVADTWNHVIRKVSPNGSAATLAGTGTPGLVNGSLAQAQFNSPSALVIDSLGNIFVADNGNSVIRKITPAGVVSTFAGTAGTPGYLDGALSKAKFAGPSSLSIDRWGNMYVADFANQRIRKITPAGVVSTLAGDGTIGQ